MTYIQVNIGRNRNGVPMDDAEWTAFKTGVVQAIIDSLPFSAFDENGMAHFEFHEGSGIWKNNEEHSAHISLFWEWDQDDYNSGVLFDEQLKGDLMSLKIAYGQDAIALIITESELI